MGQMEHCWTESAHDPERVVVDVDMSQKCVDIKAWVRHVVAESTGIRPIKAIGIGANR
ncbi:hypothetical protein KAU37_01910 [Candidatus Bipolaricaulota bacterium]|nr:hypothetical protein [Candidatus Bipolaricaulota bacterium]